VFKLWITAVRDMTEGGEPEDCNEDQDELESYLLYHNELLNPLMNHMNKYLNFSIRNNGTIGDALDWLDAGYKIRRPEWTEDTYWYKRDDDGIYQYRDDHINERRIVNMTMEVVRANDWTIYEEE